MGEAPGGGAAQPHDALFRFVFGKPVHAASELRAVLPAALVDRLDLASLHPVNGSFVDEELTNRHCDVLMRTRLDGREAFVYVLIEHQSSPDPIMPLRMLRYLMRIWDRWLEENPKAKRLPMIVPLVVYQGSRRWTYPVELSELLDVDPETARLAGDFLPRFRFVLSMTLRSWIRQRCGLARSPRRSGSPCACCASSPPTPATPSPPSTATTSTTSGTRCAIPTGAS
jgi:hypothetical protein